MRVNVIAVIVGIGPGPNVSTASKSVQAYPVFLLARNTESYELLARETDKSGGGALRISTDTSL
jgi:hypothetical protein